MISRKNIIEIKKLLSQDKVEKALTILLMALKNAKQENSLIIHFGELIRVKEAFRGSLIDWEKMSQERNRISYSILDILDAYAENEDRISPSSTNLE